MLPLVMEEETVWVGSVKKVEVIASGPAISGPVIDPVTGAIRDVMAHDVEEGAAQDGVSVMVNDQVCPTASVTFGEIVIESLGAAIPAGDVETTHPVDGTGIVIDRRATDVVPKSDGTTIAQVNVLCCVRTIGTGDRG
jgi:hypothetical protein